MDLTHFRLPPPTFSEGITVSPSVSPSSFKIPVAAPCCVRDDVGEPGNELEIGEGRRY